MSVHPSEAAVLRVAASLAEIDREDWNRLAHPGWQLSPEGPVQTGLETSGTAYNPFLSYDFLWSLEESGSATARTGWAPRPLVLEGPAGRPAGVVPCWAKTHSKGEYVFDQGWARAYEQAGGRYYPKLQVSVPFTPATGPRLLVGVADGADDRRRLLARGLAGFCDKSGASSVHATFLEAPDTAALTEEGWLARTDQQFHWPNRGYRDFDDFLDGFQSRKRKQVRRERRDALLDGVEIVTKTGAEISEADWDAFFAFYMDTGGRKWGRPYLNRTAFSLIGSRMAAAILLILAYRRGRPIAGALNMVGSDALYGRYWGAIEEQPFLHFEVCYYQAIDFAIRRGLQRVEAGAQGEHKLARGYLPTTTHSAHYIADPGLRLAIGHYLDRERREVAAVHDLLSEHAPYRRDEGCEPDGF